MRGRRWLSQHHRDRCWGRGAEWLAAEKIETRMVTSTDVESEEILIQSD